MDHPLGRISLLNLASVRDFEARIGRPVRIRAASQANVWIEGWPPGSRVTAPTAI
jgi:hypothetical protein